MNVESGEAASGQANAGSAAATLQTPGALLEQERKRRGLTLQQAADGLHLDPWIIEAIEANRFVALGAPVYAKGYLRKYAALLELAPEVIVARYEALTDTPPEPTPIPVITTAPPPRPKWPKYVGWAIVAALLIAMGVAAFDILWPPPEDAATSIEPAAVPAPLESLARDASAPETLDDPTPVDPGAGVAAEAPSAPESEPASETVAAESSATASSAVAETSSPASATEDPVRVRLEFSEPSWAEIYDASGQRLLYDIGQPGRARTVVGSAPLTVVIGVTSAVSMQVNDRPIVVPRRANRNATRFVVNADGSVR